jgi:excisionase family DNA binding protein
MDDLITTQEAAEVLGVTPRRVLTLIRSGRLPARTIGNSRLHLIARADLELVKVRPNGRPKKPPEPEPKPKGKRKGKDA